MSTSAIVAQSDLSKQIPSCSFTTPSSPVFETRNTDLDSNSWSEIFEEVALTVPLKKALEFKTLHSVAYHSVNRAFRKVTKLKIEVYEANSRVFNGTSTSTPVYIVQDSSTKNAGTAVEMVKFVVSNSRCLKHLDLYFEDQDLDVVNRMLDAIMDSENVRLETLHVKRRHAGVTVAKIGKLVSQNAESLREISRIGISEASLGFNDQINLERFACMSFDLGFQPPPNQIPLHMIRMTESGAKFSAFSFTSFSGFDPTDEVVQSFLEKCEVSSIKLTMMSAPRISQRPGYMIGKIRAVKKIELVEIVPEPQRINKLLPIRHVFEKVFPCAQDNLLLLQQWN